MIKNKLINITSNNDSYTLEIKNNFIKILDDFGFNHFEGFSSDALLNVSIGGDGAFLNSVRNSNYSNIPFVGINTGTLGFYPEITPENMKKFIEDFIDNNYKTEEINLIESEIHANKKHTSFLAVNDIAIKRNDMKTIHLSVFIDSNHLETISGDGLIISSPMGSSAYSMSAGGSLVYPSLKTLQITPLSPIISNAYRCLTSSIIVPPEFEIDIYTKNNEKHISFLVDGESFIFEKVEKISFRTSKKSINRITTGSYNYWKVIKEKFL